MTATLDQLAAQLATVNLKLDVLMSQQDALNADVAAIGQAVLDLTGAVTTEIAALKASAAANQPLDFGPLDAKVTALRTAVANVKTLAAPPAPPAP